MTKKNPDENYVSLMQKYNDMKFDPSKQEESLELLDRAMKLRRENKISEESIDSVRY